MSNQTAFCPLCNSAVEFSSDLLDKIIVCSNCKEEIVFSENDIIDFLEVVRKEEELKREAARKEEELKREAIRQRKREERAQTEYCFIILEFSDIGKTLNNLWLNEGWQVVSQSTVFLSESSAGFGGLSNGSRTEGIAYTLKREKIV